jgi:Tc toxin complex TcA C-terminal TcB-binding domain
MTVENFTPSALPLNPRLMALYNGVAESLVQLHQSDGRNITTYNTAIAQRAHTSALHLPHRRHPYRFTYLLPKAQQLAEAASSLGSALLSALQTGDAEYLSSVQATQERQLTSLSLPDKKEQFRAADWDVKALQISLQKALCDLSYYQTLVRNGPSAGEQAYINSTQLGLFERTAAQGTLGAAQGVSNLPDIYAGGAGAMGSPLEFQRVGGGSEMWSSLNFAAQILTNSADSENIIAGLQQTQAEWARRLDDWNHTIDMDTIDIQGLECQKLAADRRHDSALYELNATQRQIEHAIEVQDFLRDKTTAFDLYLFLQRETALLYRQTYNVALQAAREAQEMLHYELRGPPRDFVADCTWSTLRDGLVAGDKLALALQAMDRAYTENNTREHELSKQLSLNLHFPAAFLRLKATGAAEFAVPEWMFDLDYPGMYMRRIRSVSVTIPCVVGPYTGIHARLELQGSRIRVSPDLSSSTSITTTSGNFGAQSYECQSPATDTRFVHLYGTREAIATSSGLGDSGLFELNFNDDRYLPFEFAGAISHWRIELPPDNNEFSLATLTDFVITLNYMAREGGEELRHAAAQAARARLPGDGFRLFDVKHELSDLWATLKRSLTLRGHAGWHKKGEEHGKVAPPLLRLPFHRNMFPFLNGRRILSVVRLQLFVQAEEPQPDGSYVRVRYHPSGYSYEEDVDEYLYDSSTREFDCVVNAEWPGLYHGVIDVDIEVPPAGWSEGKGCGTLTFPERMFDVRDVYILCQYKVRDATPGSGQKRAATKYWRGILA